MNKERINKAVEIIEYAINNQVSVKEASVLCGYADTYVKNIKALVYEKYENGILEDELFSIFDTAYKKYVNNKGFGLKSDDVDVIEESNKEKTTIKQDKPNEMDIEWKCSYPKNHIKTLDQLLKECKVDLDLWNVKDYIVNKWDVTSFRGTNPETIQNFQVKARLEKNIKKQDLNHAVDVFKNMIKNYKTPVLNDFNYVKKDNNENLLEISIFDLHLGKLAWHGETGENYDTKIASKRFIKAIHDLIEYSKGFAIDRIVFPIGSDFYNSDTIFNTTTKGTPQDEDLRWQKTFKLGCSLVVDGINILKQTGVPIDVIIIPGNHDFERSFYLGSFLEAWFNNDSQVNIDNGASPRKYYKYGQVLIGYTHGDEEKRDSLPMIMANDHLSKPLWSETKYHEWHLGHEHRKKEIKYTVLDKSKTLEEDLGVVIRYLSSLTSTEEWHHKKGFIGQIKAADGFIWNYNRGFVVHLNTNIDIE